MEPRQLRLPGFTRFWGQRLFAAVALRLPRLSIPTNHSRLTTNRLGAPCDVVSFHVAGPLPPDCLAGNPVNRSISLLALSVAMLSTPAFAQTTVARLANDLAVLRQQGFKLAVIDTPPAITMAIQSVIAVAELIVIPTRPSPHDLRAVGATVDLCDRAGKPLIFVVNAATPKAKITYEAAVALSQHGTVAPVTLHHRTDFAASMIDGRTVMEVDPKGRSAREVVELWDYVADRLEKNFRRTVFSAPGMSAAPIAAARAQGGFGRRVVGQ